MINNPPPPDVKMGGTVTFMLIGLVPIAMFLAFWMRSGTGLNLILVGYAFLLLGAFLVALNYYMFYRQHLPRSALRPINGWWGIVMACILIPLGAYNMLATSAGVGITLSPGARVETAQLPSLVMKVVLTTTASPGTVSPIKLPPRPKLDLQKNKWLINPPFMGGALWGALGYAIPFGLAAMFFGLVRQEVVDPRDEHLGSGAVAGLVRGAVGLFYGSAVGFALGAVMIRVLRWIFPTVTQTTPTPMLHWIYVLGAATNPNVAFGYAFSTACLLAGSLALFSGRRDFTAAISDPKAPELTRPIEVMIPEVPDPPEVPFNMTQVAHESQSILQQFNAELNRVLTGPEWTYERYDLPPVGRPSGGGKTPVPETLNVISSRHTTEFDDESAMGSLSDVFVEIVGDLGKLEIAAADWLCLAEGAILELPKQADTPISISINGKPAGRGVPLVVEGYKAVKVVSMRAETKKDLANRMKG
ncbi:MAG: hypothetical protein JWM80_6552 [Cyanobacteria bacterium RYN_339]|nr:hypothetical protein [Cyanobacteria bacterium RYN_339]